jgi:hypothetical protein
MTDDNQLSSDASSRFFGKPFKRYITMSFAWAVFCIFFGLLVFAPLARVDGLGLYPMVLLAILPAIPTFLIFMLLGAVLNIASIVPEQFMNLLGFGTLFISFILQAMIVSWVKSKNEAQLKNQNGAA